MEPSFLGNQQILEFVSFLFRVSSEVKHGNLKSKLEESGISLLVSHSAGDMGGFNKELGILEELTLLGESIGEIYGEHAHLLYRQYGNMKAAIQEKLRNEMESVSVLGKEISARNQDAVEAELDRINLKKEAAIIKEASFNAGAVERQDQVVDKIRQLGNAAMKDVIAAFPEVSERTLRYDLQKLCEQSKIERIGPGGPGSYYRLPRTRVEAESPNIMGFVDNFNIE